MTARSVTLVSAQAAGPRVRVDVLVDGRQEALVMDAHVAAALLGDVARVLGSSALYDAGLERAAQIAQRDWPEAGNLVDLIREEKIGRRT